MCTYSMVADGYLPQLPQRIPWVQPYIDTTTSQWKWPDNVSREEFDALKKRNESFKEAFEGR